VKKPQYGMNHMHGGAHMHMTEMAGSRHPKMIEAAHQIVDNFVRHGKVQGTINVALDEAFGFSFLIFATPNILHEFQEWTLCRGAF